MVETTTPGRSTLELERDGAEVSPNTLSERDVDVLIGSLQPRTAHLEAGRHGGARDLAETVDQIRALADHPLVRDAAVSVLGSNCHPARTLLFDKTPAANWPVVWHQDLTIAVRKRIDVEGYGPWSVKDGMDHVQPPTAVLKQMVAVRVHLDDCGTDNGPLRVLPGSHRFGKLTVEQVADLRRGTPEVECLVSRGGLLVMRPLLLHASSRAKSPGHRRVIHIEFAACELDGGLEWAHQS